MKIHWAKEETLGPDLLENFADRYGLDIVVTERKLPGMKPGDPMRFYATFSPNLYEVAGVTQTGLMGNGSTQELAVQDLCRDVSGKLVINLDNRQKIKVPILTWEPK